MSQIEMLRLLITERLTAAAEEIFGVFGRTIAEYEEQISRSKLEIERQRRMLDLSMKPEVLLQGTRSDLCEQQDWSSGLDELEAPPIKEEEEELWSSQQEESEEEEEEEERKGAEQNNVKFALFQSGGGVSNDRVTATLPKLQDLEPDTQPGPSGPKTSSDLDQDLDQDSPDATALVSGNGRLDGADPDPDQDPDLDPDPPLSEVVDSYICNICGRAFAQQGHWARHVHLHRRSESKTDRSYTCDICGKRLTRFDGYQKHLRVHTGEKPYCCVVCGRRFSDNSNYKRHVRTHVGPKS